LILNETVFDIIQMMHCSEWTLKYDERIVDNNILLFYGLYMCTDLLLIIIIIMNPRLKMSHEGAAQVRHFQPRFIIFQYRTNDRASYVLSYGQPVA